MDDYQRSRVIAAQPCSARAIVDTDIKALLGDAATAGAALRRLERSRVRNQEFATSFCRFVANHVQKCRRRAVENGAVEPRLLRHIAPRLFECAACRSANGAYRKFLGRDQIVLGYQLRQQLVQEVLAACSERREPLGQHPTCLAQRATCYGAAPRLLRQLAAARFQHFHLAIEVARVRHLAE